MASNFMNGSAREARRWLRGAVRRIVAKAKPDKVILFGSRSSGRPRRDSDFDLLVIASRPRDPGKLYDLVDDAIGEHLWPVDLLALHPQVVKERLRVRDQFFEVVLRRGEVLYES